jgi:WYL domain
MSNQILLEAIATKKCVWVTYNRTEMKLAPHILYTKNDAFYLDAVALERNGTPPREKKLGAYHLAGLSAVVLGDDAFQVEPVYDPAAERYAGTTMFAVDA